MLFEWLYEKGYLMSPAENIFFLLLAFGAFVLISVSRLFLRKQKKWARIVTGLVVMAYIISFLFYPTYREMTQQQRYERLLVYLEETYPEAQFSVKPEKYEPGYQVGDFDVSYADTDLAGVVLRVEKDGEVEQISTWTNYGELTQESLWRTLMTGSNKYSLDEKLPHVEKKGQWIDGEWTVFAVTLDERPVLAFFNYDKGGYSSWPVVEGKCGEIVTAEWQERFFVYIDEAYTEETITLEWRDEQVQLNVAEHRGKLVVLP